MIEYIIYILILIILTIISFSIIICEGKDILIKEQKKEIKKLKYQLNREVSRRRYCEKIIARGRIYEK